MNEQLKTIETLLQSDDKDNVILGLHLFAGLGKLDISLDFLIKNILKNIVIYDILELANELLPHLLSCEGYSFDNDLGYTQRVIFCINEKYFVIKRLEFVGHYYKNGKYWDCYLTPTSEYVVRDTLKTLKMIPN